MQTIFSDRSDSICVLLRYLAAVHSIAKSCKHVRITKAEPEMLFHHIYQYQRPTSRLSPQSNQTRFISSSHVSLRRGRRRRAGCKASFWFPRKRGKGLRRQDGIVRDIASFADILTLWQKLSTYKRTKLEIECFKFIPSCLGKFFALLSWHKAFTRAWMLG